MINISHKDNLHRLDDELYTGTFFRATILDNSELYIKTMYFETEEELISCLAENKSFEFINYQRMKCTNGRCTIMGSKHRISNGLYAGIMEALITSQVLNNFNK